MWEPCNGQIPRGPESIFSISLHCKRDSSSYKRGQLLVFVLYVFKPRGLTLFKTFPKPRTFFIFLLNNVKICKNSENSEKFRHNHLSSLNQSINQIFFFFILCARHTFHYTLRPPRYCKLSFADLENVTNADYFYASHVVF